MPIQVLHVYNSDYTGKYGRRIFHILKQQKTKNKNPGQVEKENT